METGNFGYVADVIRRDYAVGCGRMLEAFYRDLLADTGPFNRIGSYGNAVMSMESILLPSMT